MKEGDSVIFASADTEDRILWVQALYRATGQSYKPQAPSTHTPKVRPAENHQVVQMDKKHTGLEEYTGADPCKFDQPGMFDHLQRMTLQHRLNDQYACLGWFRLGIRQPINYLFKIEIILLINIIINNLLIIIINY